MRTLLLAAAGAVAAALVGRSAAAQVASPTLVVHVTVDQLRPDYLERWRGQFTGAFKRFLDEGRFYRRAVHDHAITETAPGHAAILSGRFPYSTGIARNSDGVGTSDAPLVGSPGDGASPARFRGTTLADWMVAAEPRTRVLSVSRKDRGAILPVGRGRFPVFWYAPATGRFVTSRWYADSLPSWVQAFNAEERAARRYAGRDWDLLLGESNYPEADSVVLEGGGGEFLFPHLLYDDAARAASSLPSYPWMDELTLDFALAGVKALELGAGPQVDLLAISLSSTDAVGHRWGPDSRELHDQVLRLDRMLGAFLDSLIALRGADRIVLSLTSDHGVAPIPGLQSSWGDNRRARRLDPEVFTEALRVVAKQVRASGIPAEAFSFSGLTLEVEREATTGREGELREIARAFAKAVVKGTDAQRADVIDDLARADTLRDVTARRWLHMFRPGGDVLVAITLKPYDYLGFGNVATHGSPHEYDARVPLIFWGASVSPGISDVVARVVDLAPTLAAYLGVTPLERLDGRRLEGVFQTTGGRR